MTHGGVVVVVVAGALGSAPLEPSRGRDVHESRVDGNVAGRRESERQRCRHGRLDAGLDGSRVELVVVAVQQLVRRDAEQDVRARVQADVAGTARAPRVAGGEVGQVDDGVAAQLVSRRQDDRCHACLVPRNGRQLVLRVVELGLELHLDVRNQQPRFTKRGRHSLLVLE